MNPSKAPDAVACHCRFRVAATALPRSTSQPTSLPLTTISSGGASLYVMSTRPDDLTAEGTADANAETADTVAPSILTGDAEPDAPAEEPISIPPNARVDAATSKVPVERIRVDRRRSCAPALLTNSWFIVVDSSPWPPLISGLISHHSV